MAQSTQTKRSIPAAHILHKIAEWRRQRATPPRPFALVWTICPRCKGAGCDECWGTGTIQNVRA